MGFFICQMVTQDMKYTLRNLARRPGFAAVTIIFLILFCVAGAAGLLIVHWISKALASGYLLPGMERITVDFTVDMSVAGFAVILSLATGLLFGLVPALKRRAPI